MGIEQGWLMRYITIYKTLIAQYHSVVASILTDYKKRLDLQLSLITDRINQDYENVVTQSMANVYNYRPQDDFKVVSTYVNLPGTAPIAPTIDATMRVTDFIVCAPVGATITLQDGMRYSTPTLIHTMAVTDAPTAYSIALGVPYTPTYVWWRMPMQPRMLTESTNAIFSINDPITMGGFAHGILSYVQE